MKKEHQLMLPKFDKVPYEIGTTEWSYKDARGAVPRPPGAPLAEDAIRKGRD